MVTFSTVATATVVEVIVWLLAGGDDLVTFSTVDLVRLVTVALVSTVVLLAKRDDMVIFEPDSVLLATVEEVNVWYFAVDKSVTFSPVVVLVWLSTTVEEAIV